MENVKGNVLKYKVVLLILAVCNAYFLTFFFNFSRIYVMTDLVSGETQRSGPQGITVLLPKGNETLQATYYYFYYPIHSLLEYKRIAQTYKNLAVFEKEMEAQHEK